MRWIALKTGSVALLLAAAFVGQGCGDATEVETSGPGASTASSAPPSDGGTPVGHRCDALLADDTLYPPFGTLDDMLAVTDSVVVATVTDRRGVRMPPDPGVWDAHGEIRHLVTFRSVELLGGDRIGLDQPIWVSTTSLRRSGEPVPQSADPYLDLLTQSARVVLLLSQDAAGEPFILQPGPLPVVNGAIELPECALYLSEHADQPSTLAEIDGLPLAQFARHVQDLATG